MPRLCFSAPKLTMSQQLRATTTAAAEEVKSAISHSDWSTREWQTLRRIKLEELLATVYEVREWLDRDMSARFGNGPKVHEKSPISKLEVVSRLYFPEIFEEVLALGVVYHAYRIWVLTVHKQFLHANQDELKMQSIFDGAKPGMQEHHQMLLDATSAIEEKAPKLMQEIWVPNPYTAAKKLLTRA